MVIHVTPKSNATTCILGAKGCTVNNIAQRVVFYSLVDMDPRLVVALFDLPRDADISELVLRFGVECELVWLNDKNALASGVASAGATTTNAWGVARAIKDRGGVAAFRGNTWKKPIVQEPRLRKNLWDAEEWSKKPNDLAVAPSAWRVNEAPPAASSDRWSILEPEITFSLPRASITMK
ncbi:hypothetical protein BC332_33661 [Capsicum chinense]|nr:hypothetical protein BC332_33661 [Capsicum chinense]